MLQLRQCAYVEDRNSLKRPIEGGRFIESHTYIYINATHTCIYTYTNVQGQSAVYNSEV